MTLPELKIPWHAIDAKSVDGLARELEREVGPEHILYGKKAQAIAARQDCDDVLFAIQATQPEYAVVHLTWIMKTEIDPRYPSTEIFESLEDWQRLRMIPDHEDFTG